VSRPSYTVAKPPKPPEPPRHDWFYITLIALGSWAAAIALVIVFINL
jgi:hypothetical protein